VCLAALCHCVCASHRQHSPRMRSDTPLHTFVLDEECCGSVCGMRGVGGSCQPPVCTCLSVDLSGPNPNQPTPLECGSLCAPCSGTTTLPQAQGPYTAPPSSHGDLRTRVHHAHRVQERGRAVGISWQWCGSCSSCGSCSPCQAPPRGGRVCREPVTLPWTWRRVRVWTRSCTAMTTLCVFHQGLEALADWQCRRSMRALDLRF
jgi:hypothetical protein